MSSDTQDTQHKLVTEHRGGRIAAPCRAISTALRSPAALTDYDLLCSAPPLSRAGSKESHSHIPTHTHAQAIPVPIPTASGDKGESAGSASGSGVGLEEDEEDFDQHWELQEAVQLLCRAVECLGALINKEIAAAADRDSASSRRTGVWSHRDGDVESEGGAPSQRNPLSAADEEEGEGEGDDWEGMSGRGGIVETLAVQLAGVLHKLVQGAAAQPCV